MNPLLSSPYRLPICALYDRRRSDRPDIIHLHGIPIYVFVHRQHRIIQLLRAHQDTQDVDDTPLLDRTYFKVNRHTLHYCCCIILQRWFRNAMPPKRNQRRLAAAMALHPLLGHASTLAVLTEDAMSRIVCFMP